MDIIRVGIPHCRKLCAKGKFCYLAMGKGKRERGEKGPHQNSEIF